MLSMCFPCIMKLLALFASMRIQEAQRLENRDLFWSILIHFTYFGDSMQQSRTWMNFQCSLFQLVHCRFWKGNIWSLQPSLRPVCYPWYRSFVGSWSVDIPWELDWSLPRSCISLAQMDMVIQIYRNEIHMDLNRYVGIPLSLSINNWIWWWWSCYTMTLAVSNSYCNDDDNHGNSNNAYNYNKQLDHGRNTMTTTT